MYKVGDIVQLNAGYGDECIVITKLTNRPKNKYAGRNSGKPKSKEYLYQDSQLVRKVGTMELDAPHFQDAPAPFVPMSLITGAGDDAKRWEILRAAKPGDQIECVKNGRTSMYTFRGLVGGKSRKYVWRGTNQNGTDYRFPLSRVKV